MYQIKTKRGYLLSEVVSALQKEIRRGNAAMAGYWVVEMFEAGYGGYAWRRLLVISAEDVWGVITHEVMALHAAYEVINKGKKASEHKGRIFLAKATILLAMARKSRDADHLTNLVHDDKLGLTDAEIDASLEEARATAQPIPESARDCHTAAGKKAGKTKAQFLVEEHAALKPHQPGLFDNLVAPGAAAWAAMGR